MSLNKQIKIFAEISADGTQIVLLADGPEEDVIYAARLLQLMTPLFSPSDPPGALVCPLTFQAVVQLSTTFAGKWTVGPKLTTWLQQEMFARSLPNDKLSILLPANLVPRTYQVEGALKIASTGRMVIFDEPGPQPIDTPIFTPSGWTTLGQLGAGSIVFNRRGVPARVRQLKRFGEQPVYRVTLNDRTSTLANGSHRWRIKTQRDRYANNDGRVLSTDEMREMLSRPNASPPRIFLPDQPVLELPLAPVPVEAYVYGALLGDGSLGGAHMSISCPDDEILRVVKLEARTLGTTSRWNTPDDGRCQSLVFHRNGELKTKLSLLGACVSAEHKHVHPSYLHNHELFRRGVLAGLLDTDGCVIPDGAAVEFCSASRQLAEDVAWLARSLGAVVTVSEPQPAWYVKEGQRVPCLPKHRVQMRFPMDGPNPFRVARKADHWAALAAKAKHRAPIRSVRSVEPAGVAEVCCIEMDTEEELDRVYLTDTALIPTRNTGKTVTTILGLRERAAQGGVVAPIVVVCPNGVADSWVSHFREWAPNWTAIAWRGTPDFRKRLVGTHDVYVVSYETARRDAKNTNPRQSPLVALGAKTVVCDEQHLIKNAQTDRSRAVRRLAKRAENFVGLSGTPITHSPKNLWPALDAMAPGAWPSSERWLERYCLTIPGDYGADKVIGMNEYTEPEFWNCMLGQHRRVAKADVLTELPPKVYSIRTVELPGPYRSAYDQMAADMLAQLPDGTELSVMGVLAQLTRLSQLACAAADVETTTELKVDEDGIEREHVHQKVHLKNPSWKVDAMLEVLEERCGPNGGEQVVVFAPSRQLIDLAGAAAKRAGYRVGYVKGGQSAKDRTSNISAFQAGELDVICVVTQAGGVGITLTAARTAVFLARPWSLVDALQAEDRLHRIGAEHESIEIIDIVAKNTIDTRVRAVLKERAGALSDLVKDPRVVAELLGGASVTRIGAKERVA